MKKFLYSLLLLIGLQAFAQIPVADQFDPQTTKPLDKRFSVASVADLQNLQVEPGHETTVAENQTKYIYTTTGWKTLAEYLGIGGSEAGELQTGLVSASTPVYNASEREVTVSNVIWKVNSIQYTDNTETLFIPEASENNYRIDLIVGYGAGSAGTPGTIGHVAGVQSTDNATPPALPANTALITTVSVFGSVVQPVNDYNGFLFKDQEGEAVFNNVGTAAALSWGEKNTRRWTNPGATGLIIQSLDNGISPNNNTAAYSQRRYTIIHDGNAAALLTLQHNAGTGNLKFWLPNGNLVLKKGQRATFRFSAVAGYLELESLPVETAPIGTPVLVNAPIASNEPLGTALGKLQGQINNIEIQNTDRGSIYPTSEAPIPGNYGAYSPLQSGTYTNYGGLVVNLQQGAATIFYNNDETFTLRVIGFNDAYFRKENANYVDAGTSKNLFDKNNYLIHTVVNTDGSVVTNPPAPSAQNGRTTKIAVNPANTSLTVSGLLLTSGVQHRWAFHNSSNVPLTYGSGSSVGTVPIPATAAFFYLTYKHPTLEPENAGDALMINYGVTALPYEEYGATYMIDKFGPNEYIKASSAVDGATMQTAGTDPNSIMNKAAVQALLPTVSTLSTSVLGNNIFNKDSYTLNTVVTNTGSLSSAGSAAGARLAKIAVDPAKRFISVSGLQNLNVSTKRFAFYDANNTLIPNAYGNITSIGNGRLCIPANAAWFYLTYKHPTGDDTAAGDAVMVNYGVPELPFEPYIATATTYLQSVNNASVQQQAQIALSQLQPYFGKKLCTLGDSLTQQNMWQAMFAYLTGMRYNIWETLSATQPLGVGGSMVKPIITGLTGQQAGQSIYYRADFVAVNAPDVIIIMGGQNDGLESSYNLDDAPYTGAEVNSGDANAPSFVSAYKGTLLKLLAQNPAAKIVALAPAYTGSTQPTATLLAQYKARNDVIKAICAMYSVKCISLMETLGITWNNIGTFTSDSIHWNNQGGQRVARTIATEFD